MRTLVLFLLVPGAFAATAYGGMRIMDSGPEPQAPPASAPEPAPATTVSAAPSPPSSRPRLTAAQRRAVAAARAGDRWVNQSESICTSLSDEVAALAARRSPTTIEEAAQLLTAALVLERQAAARLRRLRRPPGRDGALVATLLRLLDRHLVLYGQAIDAFRAHDSADLERLVARIDALAKRKARVAAHLGSFTCAFGAGPAGVMLSGGS